MTTPRPLTLVLPLPLAPNRWPSSHPIVLHTAKRRYQRRAWLAALAQQVPTREPPEFVIVSAHFRVHLLRDEDGLAASLKWALDALRQRQSGKDWRNGLFAACGYYVDDDPAHLTLLKPTQEIDRKNKSLELTIAGR